MLERNGRWIWFFVLLGLLGVAAVTIPIVYNLSLQLTPAQVAEARERWRSHGPADYDLEWREKLTRAAATEETVYRIEVRRGKVTNVVRVGRPSTAIDGGEFDVDHLFDRIEAEQRRSMEDGRRDFATAAFDSTDGHPIRYVRRDKSRGERVEWITRLTPPPG
jgi:hypothetical protein